MQSNLKLIICEEKELYNGKREYKVENQHDKLFKDLFNDKEEVKKFLLNYIHFNVGNREFEKCSNSYISGEYKSYEADMVYKIKNESVYFLIEHQSTIDERMPYRMLNYSMEIYKQETDERKSRNKEYAYPLIIPIVLYTGKRKWQVERNFSAKIKYSNNKEKYIEMKYELVDINNFTEEELIDKNTAISYAMLIEKNKEKKELMSTLLKISEVSNKENVNKKLVKIIQYILSPILKEDTENVTNEFKIKEEWTMKTLQDYFLEEWTEKLAERKKEGIKEGMKIIVLNMLKNKEELEKIKKYTGIEEEEIKKIASNM